MPVCSIVKLFALGTMDNLMHYCTRPRAIVHQVIHGTSGNSLDYTTNRHEITVISWAGLYYHYLKQLCSHLFSSQYGYVISINTVDSEVSLRTMQILIRRLRQKSVDLVLHYFLKRIFSGSA